MYLQIVFPLGLNEMVLGVHMTNEWNNVLALPSVWQLTYPPTLNGATAALMDIGQLATPSWNTLEHVAECVRYVRSSGLSMGKVSFRQLPAIARHAELPVLKDKSPLARLRMH